MIALGIKAAPGSHFLHEFMGLSYAQKFHFHRINPLRSVRYNPYAHFMLLVQTTFEQHRIPIKEQL